jgi:hypothetical protein
MASSKDLINRNLAELGAASIAAQGNYESTRLSTEAQRAIAEMQNKLGYYQTRQQTGLGRYQTDVGAQTSRYGTDVESGTARQLSQNQLYGQLSGQQQEERLGRYQADTASRTAQAQTQAERDIASGRLGYDYSKLNFGQNAFNSIYGLVSPLLSGVGAGGTGDVGIDVRGVYSPNQINQQVAAARSQIVGQTALQARRLAQGAAGRGLGGQSPLLQALLANNAARSIGQGVDAERQTRIDSATANAQQVLAAQQARAGAVTGRFGALAQILGAGLGAL